MDSNSHIRYAAVFDMDGNLIVDSQRQDVKRMLTDDETKQWAKTSIESWKKRRSELFSKLGQGKYVLAVYENLKRITMPVGPNHLVYVTFGHDGGQEDIIQAVLNQKPGYGSPGLEA